MKLVLNHHHHGPPFIRILLFSLQSVIGIFIPLFLTETLDEKEEHCCPYFMCVEIQYQSV